MTDFDFLKDVSKPVGIALGVAAFTLGVVSLAMSIFVTGFFFGLAGVIIGLVGISKSHKALAIWGLSLSAAGMLLSILLGLIYLSGYMANKKIEDANYAPISLLKSPAPPLEMTDANGTIHRLADFKGRRVWLHFWYPYDLESRDTIAILKSLNRQSPEYPLLVAVSDISDANELKHLKASLEIPYPLFRTDDPNESYQDLSWPATVMIDANGNIEHIVEGYHNPETLNKKFLGL